MLLFLCLGSVSIGCTASTVASSILRISLPGEQSRKDAGYMLMSDWEPQPAVLEDDALYTPCVSYFKVSITPCDFGFDTYAKLESHPPPMNHWLHHEIEMAGLIDTLFGYCKPEQLAKQMLELGVAPGQSFMVEATFWASKHWTDCGWEYDAGVDWCIIRADPWPPEKILDAWERVLADIGWKCLTLS
jgi:hypothetical protein